MKGERGDADRGEETRYHGARYGYRSLTDNATHTKFDFLHKLTFFQNMFGFVYMLTGGIIRQPRNSTILPGTNVVELSGNELYRRTLPLRPWCGTRYNAIVARDMDRCAHTSCEGLTAGAVCSFPVIKLGKGSRNSHFHKRLGSARQAWSPQVFGSQPSKTYLPPVQLCRTWVFFPQVWVPSQGSGPQFRSLQGQNTCQFFDPRCLWTSP